MRRWILFATALVIGVALDLGTKEAAFAELPSVGSSHVVTSWFSFTHAVNKGAAFGLFQGKHTFFMLVSIVAFTAVPYFVLATDRNARAVPIVLGLILSGVIGNFWDRVVHGHVRDFLDFHAPPEGGLYGLLRSTFGTHVWPTFNVADIFITGGALLMIMLTGRDAPAPAEAGARPGGDGAASAPTEDRHEPASAAAPGVAGPA